ncbi:hypothetical protein [Gilliamella apicola]|uniref:Uncharacterized protein n=1 Tax=Gilliamella apicola TaxID=1196095 RepID=A0A2V4DV21_9GAMM|nr:hypothetical protein [Gilliamella apicola]PXZ04625.1 hypothetical protein DKK79_09760 [Gilliamella apicola]
MLLITTYSSHALTASTSSVINGRAPYLTFDGGRTQAKNTKGLLEISFSNGDKFTPETNSSSLDDPLTLPEVGQSFADINMLIPTNTDSIDLSLIIGPPFNFWGDDDGDGQGINGISATGSLNLSIVDRNGQAVTRNTVLEPCKAPYKLTLSNSEGSLKTRYGVPNESGFRKSVAIYYINPKTKAEVCYVRPDMFFKSTVYEGSPMWDRFNGFFPQSFTPSSYELNFPTTGANNFYFDLDISGALYPLKWEAISANGVIKATMTNSTRRGVRVTLTGPSVKESQWSLDNPVNIPKPSLPQVFELVGRDENNNEVLKYGFVLKQWFVNGGTTRYNYSKIPSLCNSIGYRMPEIKDLTNANFNNLGATPSSSVNQLQRHIGAGFFTEWGALAKYSDTGFVEYGYYYTVTNGQQYTVHWNGRVGERNSGVFDFSMVCAYP